MEVVTHSCRCPIMQPYQNCLKCPSQHHTAWCRMMFFSAAYCCYLLSLQMSNGNKQANRKSTSAHISWVVMPTQVKPRSIEHSSWTLVVDTVDTCLQPGSAPLKNSADRRVKLREIFWELCAATLKQTSTSTGESSCHVTIKGFRRKLSF